jgi:hypothetical protein
MGHQKCSLSPDGSRPPLSLDSKQFAVRARRGGGQVSDTEKGNFQVRLQGETIEFLIREKRRQTRVVSNVAGYADGEWEAIVRVDPSESANGFASENISKRTARSISSPGIQTRMKGLRFADL